MIWIFLAFARSQRKEFQFINVRIDSISCMEFAMHGTIPSLFFAYTIYQKIDVIFGTSSAPNWSEINGFVFILTL